MILRTNKLVQFVFFIVLQTFVNNCYSQTLVLSLKTTLPSILAESSGLEVVNRNSFWSHNDSGGNPELYNFDSTGTLLRTLKILNATNVDWEDLAKDSLGNFYVGDFGNNNSDRQDLKIYKIPNPSTITGDSVIPQVINYTYSNQFAFPPADPLKNFDMEAMIAYHDSLYLFSKDRSDPYSGYTKLYKLPLASGTYVAELIDSFYTGPGPHIQYSVTSADISPNGAKLILLGYTKCWVFSNFTGNHFFSGSCQPFNFSFLSQKEGICFITNDELYLTDENGSGTGQKLYNLRLQQIIPAGIKLLENGIEVKVFPNPFSSTTTFSISAIEEDNYTVVLYDQSGQKFFEKTILLNRAEKNISLDESVFKNSSGVFTVDVVQKNKQIFRKKILKLR